MKMNIVLAALSVGLLCLCIVLAAVMGHTENELEIIGNLTAEALKKGESTQSKALLDELTSSWMRVSERWQMLSPHEPLQALRQSLFRAQEALSVGNASEAAFEVESFLRDIKEIYRMELPLIQNIL